MSRTILSPPVDHLVKQYLQVFGASNLETISLAEAEAIFTRIIADFKSGILSLDELSALGTKFFHAIAKHHPGSDLFDVTLVASELGFYVRAPAGYKNIELFLKRIDGYYQKHISTFPSPRKK